MKEHSDSLTDRDAWHAKIIGLDDPELERRLVELERFRALLDQSNDLFFLAQVPSGRFADLNESACRQLGYPREALLAMSVSDLVPEPVWERMAALFADEGRVGQDGKTIVTAFKGDGGEMPIEMSVRLVAFRDAVYAVIVARDITGRVRAEEERDRGHHLLLALNQAAQAVQRARTSEAVYRAIGEQAVRLGFDATVFTLSDGRTHLIVSHLTLRSDLVRTAEKLTGLSAKGYRFPLMPGGFFQQIIAGGETVFSHLDAALFAETLPRPVRPLAGRLADLVGWQQSIIAPLAIGGEVQGLLIITGTDLTESDVPAITAFANQAAIALENVRLFEETQAHSHYLATLQRINVTLRSTLPLQEVLETICRDTGEALGYVGCLILIPDATGERLTLGAVWGSRFLNAVARLTGLGITSFSLPLTAEKNPMVKAYLTGELEAWSQAPERIVVGVEPSIGPKVARIIERAMGAKLAACVPLPVSEKVVGILVVLSPREQIPAEERAMLLGLADQAGLALENARLYKETQHLATFNERIIQSMAEGIVMVDADEILTFVNPAAAEMLGHMPDELVGLHWTAIIPPDQQPIVQAADERRMRGEVDRYELELLRKDGGRIPALVSGTPRFDTEGHFAGTMAVFTDITEHKRAEEVLRQNNEFLQSVLQNTPSSIFVRDLEGRYLLVNRQYQQVIGLTSEQMVGKRPEDLHRPQVAAQIPRNDRLVLESGVPFESEETVLVDDEPHTFIVTKVPLRDASGQPNALCTVATDITERKQVEEALRESERYLQDVFDAIQDGISVLDTDLNVIRTNRWMEQMYTHQMPLVGRKCYQVYQQRQSPCPWCPTLQTIETGETHTEIVPYPSDDDPIGWVELSIFPVKDEQENVTSVIEYVKDITERVRAEEARVRLATAIEQSAESVVVTDTEGTILYVNPAFEQITGYSRAEAIGQNPRILKSGKQDAAFYEDLWTMLCAGQVWHGRFVNKRKDGMLYTEDATISPVRDENDSIVSYVAVKRDVTGELDLEERYRQSQKMEAIGRLAGGVAHDFNNLLTAIQGYASLLREGFAAASSQEWPSGPTIRADLDEILKAAERANSLTQQLLAFSRKQVLRPRVLNLNEVLAGVENMLRRLIGEDIELYSILDPALGHIRADLGQIEQVILNLSVNARDAMPRGGQLTFETANIVLDDAYARMHPGVEPGPYVRLVVSDTGMGMTEEVKAHLFEPFFTTKEESKGTGLGLATVWGIVDQSGGHVGVYSELGVGTAFKIYLPRVDEVYTAGTQREPARVLPRGAETILLAEDEEMVRRLAHRVLEKCGYTVLDVDRPEDALLVSKEHAGPIHLLVTDVVMPGIGGRELAERLAPSLPGMKVLYISGYTDDAIVRHGVLEPGLAFLQKPFAPEALARKVREVLDGSPSEQE